MTAEIRDLVGRSIDGFRIECLLGHGGMGEVWKAWDGRLDRQVALKILSGGDRDDAVRFEREAKAVSGISHPNIAHIYATGRFEDRPYYVMEFIEGRSLAKILAEEGRIPGRRCLDYLRQAAEGLAEARARGVIHRDVKPDNFMVDFEDRLKVVDFGLARKVEGNDASITQTNMVVGTPKYMAPEQATGGEVDHRSDIYALGATFYHLLSGQPPFDAPTPVAVMMKHVHETHVPLRDRVPQIPAGVSAIVDRMMAKRPEHRYQTYEELLADVKRALTSAAPRVAPSTVHIPSAARPPAAASAAAAPSGRSTPPWFVVGALAVALGILVFLAYRAGRDTTSPPAPVSASRPVRVAPPPGVPVVGVPETSPDGSPLPFRRGPAAGERPAPGGSGPANAPTLAGAIEMALKAKSLANLRKVSTALQVFLNSHEDRGLPSALDELLKDDGLGLHPKELKDGWGHDLRYERTSAYKFRLGSAGQDGAWGSDDDIVVEDGVVVKGDLDEKAIERFRPAAPPPQGE